MFTKNLQEVITNLGYFKAVVNNVWYQQYLEGDTHGWHIHGQHFTGVYYLEFPSGCSKTEVCSPYNFETKQINTIEGDLIVFPAHYIHRGLPNKKIRKTIVSFNFDIVANKDDGTPALNLNLLN